MRNGMQKILASRYWLVILLLVLFAVNWLASVVHTRIDLTKEKRYTLSKTTKDLLRNLDEDVRIDVFLKGNFPAKFRKMTNSVDEFLHILKESKSSRINYRFISPGDQVPGANGVTYADTLLSMGASPINLKAQVKTGESSSLAYPYAIITYRDRSELINLFNISSSKPPEEVINSAEVMLEYKFAKALDQLLDPSRPLIGYSIGNGEPLVGSRVTDGTAQYLDPRTADLEQSLRNNYQLFTLNLNRQPFIPDTFKVVIIVKPTVAFTDQEILKIDQYIMRGGKVLMFIDNLIAEQDSLRYVSETIAYDRNLNLKDMLFRYGIRINTDLVMDLQCDFMPFAVGGTDDNPQYEFLRWNYYPLFVPSGDHIITANSGLVAGRFVNSIDTINTPGIVKTTLLATSTDSRTISTPALISLNENKNTPQDIAFNKSRIPVAVLAEGRFTSLYRNRITRAQLDSLSAGGTPYVETAAADNKIIVVADGDVVLNDVSPTEGPLPMGLNFYTLKSQYEFQFANREFLLNCMEYLVDKPGIIETRNKNIILRLLDPQKVKEQKSTLQFINLGLPILLVLLFGWIYQQLRRKKYAS